jgi:hypothetical protein
MLLAGENIGILWKRFLTKTKRKSQNYVRILSRRLWKKDQTKKTDIFICKGHTHSLNRKINKNKQ